MKADPADIAAKIIVSDAELQSAYEKFKPDYFTPESRVIEQIVFPNVDEAKKAKDRIAAGEDFLAIAKERGLDADRPSALASARKDDIPDDHYRRCRLCLAARRSQRPGAGQAVGRPAAGHEDHARASDNAR